MPPKMLLYDKQGRAVPIDSIFSFDEGFGGLIGIDYAHHEVHEGNSFIVCDVIEVSTSTQKWQITTPDSDKVAHMIFNLESTGEMLYIITEGSDRTDGTALEEVNRDRNSIKKAGVVATRAPAGGSTDGALVMETRQVGATGVGSKTLTGGGERGINEFMLKRNTKYVVAVTTYADNVEITFCIDWYEHD